MGSGGTRGADDRFIGGGDESVAEAQVPDLHLKPQAGERPMAPPPSTPRPPSPSWTPRP